MPPKRAPDAKDAKECMLQIGKYNNVVAWNLDVRASVGATYGSSALFLATDVRYVPPLPRDSDYLVTYPTGDAVGMSAELKADLKKDAFTSRQREMRKQKEDEKKIYSVLWMRMSLMSRCQSGATTKKTEEPETHLKSILQAHNASLVSDPPFLLYFLALFLNTRFCTYLSLFLHFRRNFDALIR